MSSDVLPLHHPKHASKVFGSLRRFFHPVSKVPVGACDMTYGHKLLQQVRGSVLLAGDGADIVLQCLDPTLVTHVIIVEPRSDRHHRLAELAKEQGVPAAIMGSRLDNATFKADAFDSVVLTYILCSVENTDKVLQQIYHWMKPGGVLSYIEHVSNGDVKMGPAVILFGHQVSGCNGRKSTWKNIDKILWDRGSEYTVFKHNCPSQKTQVEHLMGVAKKPLS